MQTPAPASAHRSPVRAGPATTVFEMTSPSKSSMSLARVWGRRPLFPVLLSLEGWGVWRQASRCSCDGHRAWMQPTVLTVIHSLQPPREVATAFKETHQL